MQDKELERYSRHILLPEIEFEGQKKLLQSHCLIMGAGGLGSPVAIYLAASGVGKITICDFDSVDLSNLQRQIIHEEKSIGLNKAESAKIALNRINSDIKVIPIKNQMNIDEVKLVAEGVDIIVDCFDNFETRYALNKIALYILNYHNDNDKSKLFYCWNNKKSLSHEINNKIWKGYNINPLLSINRNSKELEEDISYIFNTNSLFNLSNINIIFNNDITNDLKKNKYYFVEKKIPTYNTYKLKDNKLYDLILENTEFITKTNDRFHRVDFYSKLPKKIILSTLFDNIHTKKDIALIQWINDNSKILYKMQKKHFIKKEQLINWCNIDKITKINCINIYYIIRRKGCYCKITINHLGEIIFSYIFDIG